MVRCTGEERALARASIYRLLTLSFSYPSKTGVEAFAAVLPVAAVAADLLNPATAAAIERVRVAFEQTDGLSGLERDYQHVLTLSYSEECPAYETAFSARHIFQQASQQADLAGFYQAFGVRPHGERPDHIAMELEFAYVLALKEARARELKDQEHVAVTRTATRMFLRQHLSRWAPLIGQRVALRGAGTLIGAAGGLLAAFNSYEERFLRLGTVQRYNDEAVQIDLEEEGEFTCPLADTVLAEPQDLPLFDAIEEEGYVAASRS